MTPDHQRGQLSMRPSKRTLEEAAEFERAIAAAKSAGPSPNVHPRVHQAMIEAMRSELAVLREQLDDS
jgi:hypothetical protein